MISPPIVGVPAFSWCSSGPSSRMCWPNSFSRRYSMKRGPRKMQISIAAIPEMRISPNLTRLLCFASGVVVITLRQRFGDALQADRARALDQDRVALAQRAREFAGRLVGVGRVQVGRVLAREVAHTDQQLHPALARVLADLTVVVGGRGAELAHLAEHGDAPPFD